MLMKDLMNNIYKLVNIQNVCCRDESYMRPKIEVSQFLFILFCNFKQGYYQQMAQLQGFSQDLETVSSYWYYEFYGQGMNK